MTSLIKTLSCPSKAIPKSPPIMAPIKIVPAAEYRQKELIIHKIKSSQRESFKEAPLTLLTIPMDKVSEES